MATPGKPRQSGIPAPGKLTGIPTPGRSRASSTTAQQHPPLSADLDDVSRAFADAIKANDPAQHRLQQTNSFQGSSLSPQSASLPSQTGRRSIAGRPSSSTSTSSAVSFSHSKTSERVKTPARMPSRPSSRLSDAHSRSASRIFEVGDNVRIESLGYEGTLRYVGEIEGKQGLWAGVELSGGFAGKGKNNGTVNSKQYFSCPENCGVFVATTKLSPPTVGPGAVQRPSSVASSRSGRVTPSISGRITPSFTSSFSRPSLSMNSGRVTPSSNRIVANGKATPGTTPSNVRLRTPSKPTKTELSLTDKITAGSRASKYMSMTAKQLSSRDAGAYSPSRRNDSMYNPDALSSPSSKVGSPFTTPKAGSIVRAPSGGGSVPSLQLGKGRTPSNTPRARVPSGVAMPPPASPMSSASRLDLNGDLSTPSELEARGKALQDKIASLMSTPSSLNHSSRPGSSTSVHSSPGGDSAYLEQIQSRLQALEYENERLRSVPAADVTAYSSRSEALELERDEALSKVSRLEEELATLRSSFDTHNDHVSTLEQEKRRIEGELKLQAEASNSQIQTLRCSVDEEVALSATLRESIHKNELILLEKEELLKSQEAQISLLNSQLEKALADLKEEKSELGAQIDELRIAGQETIALYEERLNAADTERYELESRISSLEAARLQAHDIPTKASSQNTTSATEIDNETLRDQLLHFQQKIANMEDIIEDTRAAADREEGILREKVKRLREKEEGTRKEISEGRREVEKLSKSEASARNRVEELEEALRESTSTLENARAEVEALRAELANLDGLVADDGSGDMSARITAFTQRAASDRSRYENEIKHLQQLLQETEETGQDGKEELQNLVSKLQSETNRLLQRNQILEEELLSATEKIAKLSEESSAGRKSSVKEVQQQQLNGTPSSKYDLSLAREEITGLKHIVQDIQKENVGLSQRVKLLESENQLLASEADQLRQEVHLLEDNLDNSLAREETAVDDNIPGGTVDAVHLQRIVKEQKARFESELEQLRKRLADAEMKHTRMAHDLNKEISELEALVESKIYREDELEQEVERLKDKLARQKKASKNSSETFDSRHRLSSASSSTTGWETSVTSVEGSEVCEICERPGHDIFSCGLLKEELPMSRSKKASPAPAAVESLKELFCEDCESKGHVAADCPHSLDVF